MIEVRLADDALAIGRWLQVAFQRTLRVPDDGRTYPLPAGLGRLPLRQVAGGFALPLHDLEALWIAFDATPWHPVAVQVALGGINAVTGEPLAERLSRDDYLVAPPQPWLDGVNASNGAVRQFVARPLGSGHTVEGLLTGREESGGLELRVVEPKPGRFPEEPPEPPERPLRAAAAMGLGTGGAIEQKLYPDPYGLDIWDENASVRVHVELLPAAAWPQATGEPAPPTPIRQEDYLRLGIPWFHLDDEQLDDLPPAPRFNCPVDCRSGAPGARGEPDSR